MGIIASHQNCLPAAFDLSLGEGMTPLIHLQNLSQKLKIPPEIKIWAKIEGANPTASFKDRGMVVAVAVAKKKGARCVICASTGNTSAAAAAYAARANMICIVLIPSGKVASGKIAQAVAHGAHIVQIKGDFDDAMQAVKEFSSTGLAEVVNSINPMRLQGQKTIAFEVAKKLGGFPDYHALPVGNAGNITAHWIGYCELAGKQTQSCQYCKGQCPFLKSPSLEGKRPTMLGYQAAGSAPFVNGNPVNNPETVATAIRIGHPQSFVEAQEVLSESGGWVRSISDNDILAMQQNLASWDGIFCEPASATSVAGVIADITDGKIKDPSTIVCTLTGHGLKDPDIFSAESMQDVAVADLEDKIHQLIKTYSCLS